MINRSQILMVLVIFFSISCSSTTEVYKETLKLAFSPSKDVDISLKELHERTVPVMYLRPNERGRAALILLNQKDHVLNWQSADNRIVQTKYGRIYKLHGFKPNLDFVQFENVDPLALPLNEISVGMKVKSLNDWATPQFNSYQVEHEIVEKTATKITFFEKSLPVTMIKEKVVFPDGSEFINVFWFDEKTQTIIMSKQKNSHFSNVYELVEIFKISRLSDYI